MCMVMSFGTGCIVYNIQQKVGGMAAVCGGVEFSYHGIKCVVPAKTKPSRTDWALLYSSVASKTEEKGKGRKSNAGQMIGS